MCTCCVYPALRTVGDVTDCPKPQGNLPVASDNARGVDTLCSAELPKLACARLRVELCAPSGNPTNESHQRTPTSNHHKIPVERVAPVQNNHNNTLNSVRTPPLLWRECYGYCVMHTTWAR